MEQDVNIEKILSCVRHLLYWGMGKIIYPIEPNSVYMLTKQTPGILKRKNVIEFLSDKLPQSSTGEQKSNALENALKMFSKPVSLVTITQKEKLTMKEVQKTVILLQKHNLLKERKKRLVLKLSSSRDIDQL